MNEIERRAHLYLSEEIAHASSHLQRMTEMRVINPMPRLDQLVRDTVKYSDVEQRIRNEFFKDVDADVKLSYDRRNEKFVVRKGKTRFNFVQINKQGASSIEKIFTTLS